MEALLKQANVLKGEGNVAFAGSDASTAMSKYSNALSMLTKDHHDAAAVETAAREEWSSVVAALNNNLSNLCLVSEEWSKAEQHARAALNVVGGQPGALKALEDKARFRLATALYHLGRRFEAFIHMLRVSPATLDPALRRSITKAVGIASLDDAFTLQDHHAGGITAVARSDVAAGSDLFVEGQLVLSFDAAMADESTATTESRCYTFAKELLAMYMDDKRQHQFQRAERELSGSWPRHIDDVDPTVRCSVEVALADLFNGAVEDPRVREHITLLALQCRYNCFHRGFFRASALVNHGCNPNAAMKYTPGRSVTLHADLPDDAFAGCIGVVALRACREIKPGDIISVKYLGDFDFIIGVLPRREMLRSSWLFTCECDRCTADLEEGAVTEWVRCTATPGCAGFVHLPAPPCFRSDSTLDVSVPAGVRERQCRVCGQKQHLCPRTQDAIHSVRVASVSMMTSDAAMTLKQRHEACVALRKQVVDLVHDSHWAHTTVLYVFCFRTQRRVEEIFDLFGNGKLAASVVAFELGLDNFDAKSPSAAAGPLRDELDVLGWYLELQVRLQPFYPDDQLWALHMAIIRCAVVLACATPDRFIEVEPLIVTRVTHLNRNTAALIAALLQKHVKNAKALKSVLRALK